MDNSKWIDIGEKLERLQAWCCVRPESDGSYSYLSRLAAWDYNFKLREAELLEAIQETVASEREDILF